MAERAFAVAIVGATSLVGEEIIRLLGERQFPAGEVRALGSPKTAGRQLEQATIGLVGPDAFRGVDFAFFAVGPMVASAHAHDAVRAGAMVIDCSSRYRRDDGVPLIVPEANARLLDVAAPPTLVASPSSTAVGLSVVLAPLAEAAGLRRVLVSTYQSAAGAGRRAVEHLSKESIALLSGRGDDDVAMRRAFNCVPQVGTVEIDGVTSHERAVADEVRRVLALPELAMHVTAVRVPMFFGMGATVLVELERPLDRATATTVLRSARGLIVHDDTDEGVALPTPADVVGSQATHVARLHEDRSVAHGLALWMALDSIEKGAALNAVQIAEVLLRRVR
jgi:aspartate-semialdehyde dehydrogenase